VRTHVTEVGLYVQNAWAVLGRAPLPQRGGSTGSGARRPRTVPDVGGTVATGKSWCPFDHPVEGTAARRPADQGMT